MYKFDGTDAGLIRNRINENLLNVSQESENIKNLLKLSLQTVDLPHPSTDSTFENDAYHNIDFCSRCTSRKDLLRIAIILATSRNTVASENLIHIVSNRLGTIKDKDYRYIANLIFLKDKRIVDRVNKFLSHKLKGFFNMHCKYYKEYYLI